MTHESAIETESMQCDVLVIGAGMAGLTAAGFAAQHGASVIVVEKAKTYGGSALLSGGILWTATSPERMRLYGGGKPELGEVVLRNYARGLDWLRHRGVAIGPAVPVLHGRGYQIDILDHLRGCTHFVEQHGGHVALDTETTSLLTTESGAVTGARLATAGQRVDVRAKAVILATGGYQNSAQLRARHIHQNARADLLLRTNPISVGDGLRLAGLVGAEVNPTNGGFYGHLVAESPRWGEPRLFAALSQYHSEQSLLFNEDGIRFCDESLGDHTNTNYVVTQRNARAICFWDARINTEFATTAIVKGTEVIDKMQLALELGARGVVTSDLEEIGRFAAAERFDGARLCSSILHYNLHSRTGWETLDPRRSAHAGAVDKPPFYALVVRPAITHTHGGIGVDRCARVLKRDATPVPGLFAAGADVDGIYGTGYAGGLAMALAFGLEAARSAGFGAGL